MEKDPFEQIRRVALRALTRRDYSHQELTLKLAAKHFDSAAIDTVLGDLQRAGLINEARFTENFIQWRRARGYGPVRISMELQARGIPAEMIAEQLEIADNAWLAEVRKVWQKHFKGKQPRDFADRAKQMRFLQYRGFSREQIESIFKDN